MRWIHWRWLVLITLAVSSTWVAGADRDSSRIASNRRRADLQQTLESGLKARRPSEFAFIERVVAMVEQGKLPEDLVRSTFAWARHKRPYPFPFFQRGLQVRAASYGIDVR